MTDAFPDAEKESSQKFRVAIVGGGPGGLFAAWHLRSKLGDLCEITVFEGDNRLGGKIVTKNLPGIGDYEAGVAEIYDYSKIGPDPLHELITNELGLELVYLEGGPCFLRNKLILSPEDLSAHFGSQAHLEVVEFHRRCVETLSSQDYYLSHPDADNLHPWRAIDGADLLQNITDETARRYIRVMAHSDVAAAPYQTNGLTFLKNAVMDIGDYMRICSVVGGNEKIVEGLVQILDADIRLNAHICAVAPIANGAAYRLDVAVNGAIETHDADFVILATPLTALAMIHWRSESLQNAIDKHISYFDRPAHYLRAVLVFERPFWRESISTHWWMLDQFDGCCVYDESARNNTRGYGVLSFLIAGNAALALANLSDERVERLCLDALPPQLSMGRRLIVESRVHRWMASVNAVPGGIFARARMRNHEPDPCHAPGVLIVGDYLFDSTLNGVMDSADAASDIVLEQILKRRHAAKSLAASREPDDQPQLQTSIANAADIWPAHTLAKMFATAWGLAPGAKILHFGCGHGRLAEALCEMGYDAYGVEFDLKDDARNDRRCSRISAQSETLPFGDQAFDVVIETGLYRTPPQNEEKTIKELRRISKIGLFLGSPVIDSSMDLLEQYCILDAAQILKSRWDWSEALYPAGFRPTLMGAARLDAVWAHAVEAGAGPGHWCEDIDGVLYSFYETCTPRP